MANKARLLVCSVFAGSALDEFWLTLQRNQLDETMGAETYDHACYLGWNADYNLFTKSLIVGGSPQPGASEHLDGLHALVKYCQSKADCYSDFLILDSDAFPIKAGWIDILNQHLQAHSKSYATAVRTENLDTFPHPCVIYCKDPRVLVIERRPKMNLLGRVFHEIECRGDMNLPLIKTNRVSVHPVLATIYFDLFYHHGCGSRQFCTRSTKMGYYDEILHTVPSAPELTTALKANPTRFIALLTGMPHYVSQWIASIKGDG